MRDAAAVGQRHPEFAAVLRAVAAGQRKPVYLFTGEPFETKPPACALLDVLVPESRRSFNLEIYDGRTTALNRVIDSLRTPGFFPGVKVVWVRESAIFLSGEKRSDVAAALLRAWGEGREDDATDKLLTLIALAGWSDEQFRETRWSSAAKSRVREVFGGDVEAGQLAQFDAVHAACLARGLGVNAYRDDSAALLEFFDAGPSPQVVLLFTASAIDARKRVCKRLREIGEVVDFSSARERSGALSRDTVEDLARATLMQFGKRLAPGSQDLILRRAGTELAAFATELEKLCLYVGARPEITADDVRTAFRDMGESWIFDFTAAVASRQLVQVLPLLRGLIRQGEPPLRLLAMVAREVRLLLVARECLADALGGKWRPDTSFNVFQARILPQVDAETRQVFGNAHPFVLYRRFQDAARISVRTLRDALLQLSELDIRLKSSRGDAAILIEAFLMDWCRPESVSRQPGRVA